MKFKQSRTAKSAISEFPFHQIVPLRNGHLAALRKAANTRREDRISALQKKRQEELQALYGTYEAPYEGSDEGRSDIDVKEVDDASLRRRALQTAVEEWIAYNNLKAKLLPAMPRILAELGSRKIDWDACRDSEGKIDALKVLRVLFDRNSDQDIGLHMFLMADSRGCWLPKQYSGDGKQFCALVPLILYAFRMYQDIQYSEWSRDNLHLVVNLSLCELMLWETSTPSTEELLKAREVGLTYASGPKTGQVRNAETTYKLYTTSSTCMKQVPYLVSSTLTQIWCAHPKNRTTYMILDPHDWDNMPEPLIAQDFWLPQESQAAPATATYQHSELAWDI